VDLARIAEAVGVVTAVSGVYLTIRQRVWCWPVGMVGVTLLAFVFFHSRLYASSALQLVYLAMSAYGWYEWAHPRKDGTELPVTKTPRVWYPRLAVAGVTGAIVFGLVLSTQTDASIPFVDAANMSLSLVAQFLATRKWIENWYIWIVVNIVSFVVYLTQGLFIASGLYVVFLVLAFFGHRAWRQSMQQHEARVSA
jgi:nicotinamide mononucleotide transporter